MLKDRLTLTKNENSFDITLTRNEDYERQYDTIRCESSVNGIVKVVGVWQFASVTFRKEYIKSEDKPYQALIFDNMPDIYDTHGLTIFTSEISSYNKHIVMCDLYSADSNIAIRSGGINRGITNLQEDETNNETYLRFGFDVNDMFTYNDIVLTIICHVIPKK